MQIEENENESDKTETLVESSLPPTKLTNHLSNHSDLELHEMHQLQELSRTPEPERKHTNDTPKGEEVTNKSKSIDDSASLMDQIKDRVNDNK